MKTPTSHHLRGVFCPFPHFRTEGDKQQRGKRRVSPLPHAVCNVLTELSRERTLDAQNLQHVAAVGHGAQVGNRVAVVRAPAAAEEEVHAALGAGQRTIANSIVILAGGSLDQVDLQVLNAQVVLQALLNSLATGGDGSRRRLVHDIPDDRPEQLLHRTSPQRRQQR